MSALVVMMWQAYMENKLSIYTLKMITFFFRKIKKQIFPLPSAPPSRRVGGREIKTGDRGAFFLSSPIEPEVGEA